MLLEVLGRRFVELGLEADPDVQGWHRLLARRLAAAALWRAVSDETEVPAAAVDAAFRGDPHRFDHEQRWQLQNLFKRFPDGASENDRERLRREMATLRERLVTGEDFAAVARQESDSTTRDRGGWLGSAPLSALHPAVAHVVAELEPGQLSPVVETSDGLTLLRCASVIPAVELGPEETRRRLADAVRQERVERAWDELTSRLLAALAPAYQLTPYPGSPEAFVVTVRDGATRVTLDRRDLELYLRDVRAAAPATLAPEELRARAEELVLQLGRAREAERRGLTATDAHRDRLAIETLELRAELALEPEIRARLEAPSATEVAALYERRRADLVEPAQLHLRTLEVPISPDLPASLYRRVRELGVQLAGGQLKLEQARDALAPHARLEDLGWLTERQAWRLGRTVETALAQLQPGGCSTPVQEGRNLLVLHLVERREEVQLDLDAARSQLVQALTAARRERIRAELRAALLADQDVEWQP